MNSEKAEILYIGQLWEGSTTLERMRLLEGMGARIIPFDTAPWVVGGNRLLRSLAHRTNIGPPVSRLNQALASFASTLSQVTHVWVDKGRWVYPETLLSIKQRSGANLIHYTPDAQLVINRSRYFDDCIPLYDVVVTTKPFEVEPYRRAGAKDVLLVLQGYDDRFMSCTPSSNDQRELGSDVCFIGHRERHYSQLLRAAKMVTEHLKIWGPGWSRYARFHPWVRTSVAGEGIWGKRYPLALSCSKIALGLLMKQMPETTTTRSFEIPAAGVFMLAERTDDHQALFEEGVEAEFFGSEQELKEKIVFYLKHDDVRGKIAAAGRARCLRSGYHSREQLQRVLDRAA
jgi:spore maturation protein CgeB